jgi:hypothetical protein
MAKRGHNGHGYRQIRHAVLYAPEFIVCELPGCHKLIDRSLRWPHPMSPTADMIVPFARGGDPKDPHNYRPAHYGCNSRRGAGNAVQRSWITDESP